jgi:hypothetical protein
LLPDSTLTGHLFYDNTTSQATGGNFVMSCYAKAAGLTKFGLRESQTIGYYAAFDLSTGAVIEAGASVTASIQNMGNGWYRCTAVVSASINACIGLVPLPAAYTTGNPLGYAYAGNGTDGVLVYQPQLEVSATYVTSPISTAGVASATRVADECSKTGISSLIGQTEGTIYWEGSGNATVGGADLWMAAISVDDTNVAVLVYYVAASGTLNAFINNGTTSVILDAPMNLTQNNKVALAYKNASFALYLNGALVDSSSSAIAPPTAMNQFAFVKWQGGANQDRALVNQALLFKTRLTNAQLAELTAL